MNVKKDFIKTQNLELQTKIQNNHAELLSKTTKINNLEQLKVRKIYLFWHDLGAN